MKEFTIYHNALWGFLLCFILLIYYQGVVPVSDLWIAWIFFPLLFMPGLIKIVYDWKKGCG